MLAEGAVVCNASDVTRTVHGDAFGIVETWGQRQFANSGLLSPQCGAMASGCACDLPGFIDAGRPQRQGDYFVVLGHAVYTVSLSH
jgi:hypothetical protein